VAAIGHVERVSPLGQQRRALAIFAFGILLFAGSFAFDRRAVFVGSVVLMACSVLAARETRAPVLTWRHSISAFVLLIWLMPVKTYRLPVDLPFKLELYRVLLGLLVVLMGYALLGRFRTPSAGGMLLPAAAIVLSLLVSQFVNVRSLDPDGGETVALNNFFYLIVPLIAFLLVCTAVRDFADAETVVKAIVIGGFLVAVGAIFEIRTNYNVFDHLDDWIPGLRHDSNPVAGTRLGRLRVRASAQHPIALGTVLMLAVPLAVYLISRATRRRDKLLWALAAMTIAFGAFMPIARTAAVIGAAMLLLGLILRGGKLVRFWPVLIVAAAALHFVSPGAIGALYHSFFPKEGLVQDVTGRAGLPGSGRLSDIQPGLDLWHSSPLVGIGRGNPLVGGQTPGDPSSGIIFDNQYLNTLVLTGLLGLIAAVWFLVAAASKLLSAGFGRGGYEGDFLACCGLAVTGFAVGMFFFDAFSFVQVTVVYFVIAALGLRVLQLAKRRATSERR
jgi:hypothetical protein